jgi:DNA polymerase-3 subunit alpha
MPAPPAPPAAPAAQTQSAPQNGKKAYKGIYLRVPSAASLECERAKKMCSIFDGPLPLVLFYDDSKAKDYATGISTSDDPALVKGLVKLLGAPNVVVRP